MIQHGLCQHRSEIENALLRKYVTLIVMRVFYILDLFVAEISQIEIGTVAAFLKRAEAIYEENLAAYVKIVLRRPFAKIIVCATMPSYVLISPSFNPLTGILRRCGAPSEDNGAYRDFLEQ